MLGTLINVGLIIAGTLVGLLLRKGLPERVSRALMAGMGLATVGIGLSGALKTADTLCVIVCIALGGMIGSLLDIEKQLDRLGHFAERKLGRIGGGGNFSKGFVTASLTFCVGAMAIVGSIDSGIRGDHSTLIAKGIIDCVVSVLYAGTMGVGVGFSALAVLLYQGCIALLAGVLSPVLTDPIITEMSAVGGLLVAAIGFNLVYPDRHIPVGNLLPAVFLPIAYLNIVPLFG